MCNIDLEIGSVFSLGQFYVLRKNDFTLGNKLLYLTKLEQEILLIVLEMNSPYIHIHMNVIINESAFLNT